MRLWRKFRAAYFWAKAIEAERENRFQEAFEFVRKSEELAPLKPWYRAFKATLLVRTGETTDAHKLFAELRSSLKTKEDAASRYTKHYVQSWLATLRIDPDQARYEQGQAAQIECRPALKCWLWLPDEPPRDAHDVEFDEWMKANHPELDRELHK